jgi:hypothetical protein
MVIEAKIDMRRSYDGIHSSLCFSNLVLSIAIQAPAPKSNFTTHNS